MIDGRRVCTPLMKLPIPAILFPLLLQPACQPMNGSDNGVSTPRPCRRKRLNPRWDRWMGKVLGSASLTKEKPLALEASKEFLGIILSEDIEKANLPAGDMSVTAWVRVDKPIEWGGILGAIQDNGSFERGWLLGYVKDSFFFAISSESKKRLTYLKTVTPLFTRILVSPYGNLRRQSATHLHGRQACRGIEGPKRPHPISTEGAFRIRRLPRRKRTLSLRRSSGTSHFMGSLAGTEGNRRLVQRTRKKLFPSVESRLQARTQPRIGPLFCTTTNSRGKAARASRENFLSAGHTGSACRQNLHGLLPPSRISGTKSTS